ncbi:MAG: GTPase [Planctomycetota bacterium]
MPARVDLEDVIAAPAGPPGPGVRGVVRVSGPDAVAVVQRSATPGLPRTGRSRRVPGTFTTSIGDIPADFFCWPTARSYTGQPTVEIHAPGSPVLLDEICAALHDGGARPARPGEFTMRAFLNGRIDLAQAEAVQAVIEADGRQELDVALSHLAGGPSRDIDGVRSDLLRLLAEIEAGLDFADEDIETITSGRIGEALGDAIAVLTRLTGDTAERLRGDTAPTVVFVGPPNAGKSSLVNALAGRDAAIVTPTAGTTRDTVTANVVIDGRQVTLVDTAGHDDAEGQISAAMRTATDRAVADADLVVVCRPVDGAASVRDYADAFSIRTKADLAATSFGPDDAVAVSSKTGDGLDELRRQIAERLREQAADVRSVTVGSRTRKALDDAVGHLVGAVSHNDAGAGDELVAADVRAALDALAVISGEVDTDDLLDVVFGTFCIGK